jgi:hypothetical protein
MEIPGLQDVVPTGNTEVNITVIQGELERINNEDKEEWRRRDNIERKQRLNS